jgi:glycerol-3-phosphate O-acyltransferase
MTRAVLQREDMARLLRGNYAASPSEVHERVNAYLDELRTKQRYHFYRALQHPLYPIFRKIDRRVESAEIPQRVTRTNRVLYVSNHKSHTDYLIELLVIDDYGIRPPLIAAGINLFGGPLGLLHRHITGAIPIRRNTKDPVYLITLKAYVAEVLKRHDLFFYLEGGRSYSGELKTPKTGLLHAAMESGIDGIVIIPVAIAYDLVLEDRMLAHQGTKRRQRPFAAEMAEMLGLAVGYTSRAFVTFGEAISISAYDAGQRRHVLDLAHRTRDAIGRLYKVLPTALVAASFRPSLTRRELEDRVGALLDRLRLRRANLAVRDAKQAVDDGVGRLEDRGIIHLQRGRLRVRDRTVLRYYARTIQHWLSSSSDRT